MRRFSRFFRWFPNSKNLSFRASGFLPFCHSVLLSFGHTTLRSIGPTVFLDFGSSNFRVSLWCRYGIIVMSLWCRGAVVVVWYVSLCRCVIVSTRKRHGQTNIYIYIYICMYISITLEIKFGSLYHKR